MSSPTHAMDLGLPQSSFLGVEMKLRGSNRQGTAGTLRHRGEPSLMRTGTARRRHLPALVVATVVATGVFVWFSTGRPGADAPLDTAAARLADLDSFTSGSASGDALALTAGDVLVAAERCEASNGTTARCNTLYAVSGWLQIAAAESLRCTAPGRHDIRLAALEALATIDETATDASIPDLPSMPACG